MQWTPYVCIQEFKLQNDQCSTVSPELLHTCPIDVPYLLRYGAYMEHIWDIYGASMEHPPFWPMSYSEKTLQLYGYGLIRI